MMTMSVTEEEDFEEETPLIESNDSFTLRMPPCTIVIEPLVFLTYFSVQGAEPILERYLHEKYAADFPALRNTTFNDSISETCGSPNFTSVANATTKVREETSRMMMFLYIVNILPSLITTLLIGGYSDKKYRKAALVLPTFGLVARLIAVVCAVYYRLDTYVLLAAYAFDGLTGGFATFITGVLSYIADIIKPDSRAFRIVLLDVVLAVSGALGTLIISGIVRHYELFIASLVVLGIAVSSLVYVTCILTETHRPIPGTRTTVKEMFTATYDVYTEPGQRQMKLALILIILFLAQLPIVATETIETAFARNFPLCWDLFTIRLFTVVSLLVIETGSLLGAGCFLKCMSETHVLLIGCLSGTLTYCYYGFCRNTEMTFAVPFLGLFQYLPIPMARAIGSRLVIATEQGAMFAGMAVAYNISGILASIGTNFIYLYTYRWFIGMTFVVCGGCYLLTFILGSMFMVLENRKRAYSRIPASDDRLHLHD